jgi:phage host-nuclease inhibitor protein Gam
MEKSLKEYLESEVAYEGFAIDSEEKVNWVLRKIKSLQDRKQANIQLAEAEISKIDAWLEGVNEQLDNDLEHFRSLLVAYADKQRAENPKFKSLKLPNGKISFRKQQTKWSYDDTALLASLKQLGYTDLIRTKEETNKAEIKKRFQIADGKVVDPETGELVEGISVEERPDELKIETE